MSRNNHYEKKARNAANYLKNLNTLDTNKIKVVIRL